MKRILLLISLITSSGFAETPLRQAKTGEQLLLSIQNPIFIEASKIAPLSKAISTMTVTGDVMFQEGKLVPTGVADSSVDFIACSLRVWKGLLYGFDEMEKSGGGNVYRDFSLQGLWTASSVQFTSIMTADVTNSASDQGIVRAQAELTLWPALQNSSAMEKSVFGLTITRRTKGPADMSPIERSQLISLESVASCFGNSATLEIQRAKTKKSP